MEDYTLTMNEIKIINSYFPDDEPLFVVDGNGCNGATSDWRERLKAKKTELGYRK